MPSSDTWLTKPEVLRNDGSQGFSPLQSQIDMAIICSNSSVRLADRLPFLVPATTSRLVEIKPVILSTFLPNYSDISTIIPQLYGIQWVGNLHIAWSLLLRRNCRDIPTLSQSWPNKPAGLYCSAYHQADMRGLSTCWFLLTMFLTVLRVCYRRLPSPCDLLAFINPKDCEVQEWVFVILLQIHQYVPGFCLRGGGMHIFQYRMKEVHSS